MPKITNNSNLNSINHNLVINNSNNNILIKDNNDNSIRYTPIKELFNNLINPYPQSILGMD